MIYGKVKWFNAVKGYGFISINETEDAMIHFSNIRCEGFRDLNDGQLVKFNLYRCNSGFVAEDVEPYYANEPKQKKRGKNRKNIPVQEEFPSEDEFYNADEISTKQKTKK